MTVVAVTVEFCGSDQMNEKLSELNRLFCSMYGRNRVCGDH